jgi:hypothetical protein
MNAARPRINCFPAFLLLRPAHVRLLYKFVVWHQALITFIYVPVKVDSRHHNVVAANVSWRTIPSQHGGAPTAVGGYDFLNPS